MSISAPPRPIPFPRTDLPRGVHEALELHDGVPIFIAVTCHGYIIDQRRIRIGETRGDVIVGLDDLLNAVNPEVPARPTYLTLMRDEPSRPSSSPYRSWLLCPPARLRSR